MKRLLTVAVALALAGAVSAGCSKSSSTDQSAAGAGATTGPITDGASTGLKSSAGVAAAGAGPDAVHGKAIFTQNCASCHGAKGEGGGLGPSLKSERSRKNYAATVAWIKDPKPPMPKLYPSPLADEDVADVAAYVESL